MSDIVLMTSGTLSHYQTATLPLQLLNIDSVLFNRCFIDSDFLLVCLPNRALKLYTIFDWTNPYNITRDAKNTLIGPMFNSMVFIASHPQGSDTSFVSNLCALTQTCFPLIFNSCRQTHGEPRLIFWSIAATH